MANTGYLKGAAPYPEEATREYVAKNWWLDLTYGDLLDRATQLYPNKLAVIDERVRLTYAQLKEKVDRLAIAFLQLGIGKYDRILFQLPNRYEFVVGYYAAQRIGAVPVLAVARQEYQEISHFFRLTEATAWILPPTSPRRSISIRVRRAGPRNAYWSTKTSTTTLSRNSSRRAGGSRWGSRSIRRCRWDPWSMRLRSAA